MDKTAKEYLKEQLEVGIRKGEDKSITPAEAYRQVRDVMRENRALMADYSECRKERKKAVAARLHELRKEHELKQQDAAEKTGLNVVTLSGYEIGKNEPNMEALVRLADTYGVTLDYLMCRTDDEKLKHYKGE